ncbi:hypothetical protein [Goodfellowiella coeruleoviolacea]|uniref:Uncharacterized protein n=1 Tax=Goodfellowiella coeruleoviolacea TaxID=334858 RepID=A0AAE3GII2_9PSEU|nr:hypothetical protein [Goodfellowiella coeruleoviolacea]MCP2168790.1 hypothetical protein [Goodfellowiella coeruleoviolacea]
MLERNNAKDATPASARAHRPRVTDWQLAVESRARRVRADLAVLAATHPTESDQAEQDRRAALRSLDVVDAILDEPLSWWHGPAAWWSGWRIERAWRALHEAEVATVAADPDLAGRLPALRERIANYLPEEDNRRRALEELRPNYPATSAERAVVVDTLRAAFDVSDDAHAAARALRNKLVVTAFVLVVVNTALGVLSLNWPNLIPLCVQQPIRDLPDVCPSGQAAPSGDAWLIQLLGGFGAVIAAVVLLLRRRPSLSPYVLVGYQAMIKVLLGAALATVGVMAIAAGVTQGLIGISTQSGLQLWAVLLGYSQQVGTRLLDNYADQVMNHARPLPEGADTR